MLTCIFGGETHTFSGYSTCEERCWICACLHCQLIHQLSRQEPLWTSTVSRCLHHFLLVVWIGQFLLFVMHAVMLEYQLGCGTHPTYSRTNSVNSVPGWLLQLGSAPCSVSLQSQCREWSAMSAVIQSLAKQPRFQGNSPSYVWAMMWSKATTQSGSALHTPYHSGSQWQVMQLLSLGPGPWCKNQSMPSAGEDSTYSSWCDGRKGATGNNPTGNTWVLSYEWMCKWYEIGWSMPWSDVVPQKSSSFALSFAQFHHS